MGVSATRGGHNRKAPGTATRRHNVIELAPKSGIARPPGLPDASEYLASTRQKWEALWAGPLGAVLIASADVPALTRLFGLYDEHERARRALRGKPRSGGHRVVKGSQGQPVLSPLAKYMRSIEGEIVRLEDRFGLSPAARLRMSVDVQAAQRTLDQINGSFAEEEGDDGDSDEDPRETAGSSVIDIA